MYKNIYNIIHSFLVAYVLCKYKDEDCTHYCLLIFSEKVYI